MQLEGKPKRKQKLSWLVKFTNTVLVLFILFVIAFFSLPHIVKYLNDDGSSRTSPDNQDSNRAAQEEKAKKKDNSLSSKSIRTKPETSDDQGELDPERDPFENIFEKYNVEPEPTAAHLIDRLSELEGVTKDNDNGLVMIDAYIQKGVDPNEVSGKSSPVFEAASKWMVHVLKRMHKLKGIDLKTRIDGGTIMHFVALNEPKDDLQKANADASLKYLIGIGGDVDALSSESQNSPLMHAISEGNLEMARILVDNGANVNGPFEGHNFAHNPLMLALHFNRSGFITFLLEKGADPLRFNLEGTNAVQKAVIDGYLEGLKEILLYDASFAQTLLPTFSDPNLVHLNELSGANLLHLAILHYHYEIAEFFIFRWRFDLSATDSHDRTALVYAVTAKAKAQNPSGEHRSNLEAATKIAELFDDVEEKRRKHNIEYTNTIQDRLCEMAKKERIEQEQMQYQKDLEEIKRYQYIDEE